MDWTLPRTDVLHEKIYLAVNRLPLDRQGYFLSAYHQDVDSPSHHWHLRVTIIAEDMRFREFLNHVVSQHPRLVWTCTSLKFFFIGRLPPPDETKTEVEFRVDEQGQLIREPRVPYVPPSKRAAPVDARVEETGE